MKTDDPRLALKIPTGTVSLWIGWVLFGIGLFAFVANSSAAPGLLALGSGFLAWGTGARWLHHIEEKQVLLLNWQIETMQRQAITCRMPLAEPAQVDEPPVS